MQTEQYPDQETFCQTESYKNWLSQWSPRDKTKVDRWFDHVGKFDYYTPRQREASRSSTRLPFYLIDSIEVKDLDCVDIGCGPNFFKSFYKNIWGVDPKGEFKDEELSPDWWISNWGKWSKAYAFCSMHFWPQHEVADYVSKVRGILKPGGTAVVALNRARVKDRSPDYQDSILKDNLLKVDGVYRFVWIDSPEDSGMDGNVWLWIKA